MRAPRLCRCGNRVAFGARCPCERREDAARKARFDATRPSSSARGYDRSWERASAEYLRDHRFCRRCGGASRLVDHIVPHKGNQALFWDRKNWQALCVGCHSGAKQREERRNERAETMTAFAAAGSKLYIGQPVPADADFDNQDWIEVSRVETIGTSRIAGGVEVVARREDADIGQGMLLVAAVGRAGRAFRVAFPDGTERLFVGRVLSARERPLGARLRAVVVIGSEVVRVAPVLAEAS